MVNSDIATTVCSRAQDGRTGTKDSDSGGAAESPRCVPMQRFMLARRLAGALIAMAAAPAHASDHLDTPTVVADPSADIGDLFAWTSPEARRLNLVMTIVGHRFSDRLQYAFHVDSGARFGATTATTTIVCRF
ncbi:MAG TPA: hypothetical protein VLM79_23350, partial [Kofleriaceae bacterium]|nr:hypothetical protein [Kofleriaceae bacterium]